MNTTVLIKYAAALVALAICSACSGGPAVAPSNAAPSVRYVGRTLTLNGRLVTAVRANLRPLPRYASLVPDAITKKKKYEWVFNDYESFAGIFDYPKSVAEIGEIAGDGGQGCTNVLYGYGKHIMWNMGGPRQITEYRVPKTPIKTLSDPAGMPSSCAMNSSGDLAVGILSGADSGAVVIYKNASGSGTVYKTPLDEEFFDGYDAKGNLFADGFIGSNFALVELAKGSRTFRLITTSNTVQFPGSVQWEGTYVTVFDQQVNATFQYTVSGTKATLKGTVKYTGSGDCAQTWIVKGLIYCGDAQTNGGEVFKYPAGGSPVAVFTGNFDVPLGVTAAEK